MSKASPSQSWCVVGGGFLGLTTALRLAQAGKQVTLLEAAPEIGGLAGAWDIGGVVWDKHYHVTLLSDLRTRGILEEIGLAGRLQWRQTRTGFYTDGRLVSLSSSWDFLKFPPLSFVGKMRLATTILTASRRSSLEELEGTLVEDWLRKWSGNRTTERVWLPLLRAKLGDAYKRTSAAFIVATIHRMYAARRSGMKREMFGYVSGGYAAVLTRFADHLESLGVEVRAGEPVKQVVRKENALCVELETETRQFDRVVMATPSPVIAKACPQLDAAQLENHANREYIGVVCPSVLLRKPLADYYVTNITDDGLPFTAVIEMTALVDPVELSGARLVYLPRYALADDPIWHESDDSIRERFLSALEEMYPEFRREHVEAFQVSRARSVLPVPELNYSQTLPPICSSVPGLYCLNSVWIVGGTLNVNETVALAEETTRDVLLKDGLLKDDAKLETPEVVAT